MLLVGVTESLQAPADADHTASRSFTALATGLRKSALPLFPALLSPTPSSYRYHTAGIQWHTTPPSYRDIQCCSLFLLPRNPRRILTPVHMKEHSVLFQCAVLSWNMYLMVCNAFPSPKLSVCRKVKILRKLIYMIQWIFFLNHLLFHTKYLWQDNGITWKKCFTITFSL